MELRHLKSKRAAGDEGFTLTSWLLAIFVLVIIIIAIGLYFGWFSGLAKYLPDDVDTAAAFCGNSKGAGESLANYYCYTPKEVRLNGVKQYVTCKYLEGFATFEHADVTCGDDQMEKTARDWCVGQNLKPTMKVNGKLCQVLTSGLTCRAITGASCNQIKDSSECKANANVCEFVVATTDIPASCKTKKDALCEKITNLAECRKNPNICEIA